MNSPTPTARCQIDFANAKFLKSAQFLQQCPPDQGVEIAFAGRSNAGKSSAINKLTKQGKLARTSKTPGRTQLINFFSMSDEHRLVDLPGYGFAKVPLAVKREWEKNLTEYLNERRCLRACVLLMDIRHPLQEFDKNFIAWADASELPVHALLTKSDKLKRGAAKSALLSVQREVRTNIENDIFSAQLFSSLKGDGLAELEQKLSGWFDTQAASIPD